MKLFFRQYGEGPPLVILHGLFGISDNWLTLAKQFGKDYSVYLPDLRNHGQSPHSDVFNYQEMAEDILEFVEEHNLENISLMGHSMGGKVSMLFSSLYPEFLKKLIVVDIGPKAYPVHHREIIDAMKSLDLQNIKTRKEAEERLMDKLEDAGLRQFLLKNLYWNDDKLAWRMNLEGIENEIENVGEELDPRSGYNGPTLFIKGADTSYIMDEDQSDIRRSFPKAEFVTIPDAGHWVHAENPSLFYEKVINFLKS